jgi:hypothetical protein
MIFSSSSFFLGSIIPRLIIIKILDNIKKLGMDYQSQVFLMEPKLNY